MGCWGGCWFWICCGGCEVGGPELNRGALDAIRCPTRGAEFAKPFGDFGDCTTLLGGATDPALLGRRG